jgi:hypothetical protein
MILNAPAEIAFEQIYGTRPAVDSDRWRIFLTGWNAGHHNASK